MVTHGDHDAVLPIDRCSRRLVRRLREAGYGVIYREFAAATSSLLSSGAVRRRGSGA
jgi:predicted esterase